MRISAIWKRIQLIALNIVMQAISRHVVVGEYFLTLKMIDRFIVLPENTLRA